MITQQATLSRTEILAKLLERLYAAPAVGIRPFLGEVDPRNNTEETAKEYADILVFEKLAAHNDASREDGLAVTIRITPLGKEVIRSGGYKVWKEQQEAEKKQREDDEELDRIDKRGAIADRRFNRRLAWAALIISLATSAWTVYKDTVIDSQPATTSLATDQLPAESKTQKGKDK